MPEINEILADVQKEGAEPFEDLVKETPTDSPTDKKPEEVKEEDKPEEIPFHKHPRWIERERELNELREREEQNARELAELKSFKDEVVKNTVVAEKIPD